MFGNVPRLRSIGRDPTKETATSSRGTEAILARPLLRRLVSAVSDFVVDRYVFDVYTRERLDRQEFFFKAFKALRFNAIAGDYAEFGSWGATTFAFAYRESNRHGHPAKLWAFDSFQGLPAPAEGDEHPRWVEGRMAMELKDFHARCADRRIPREAYEVVPGFYEETLVSMSPTDPPVNIALAYVDCDLYSSTKVVLDFLEPRLKHGMIVAFDDYFCWSSSQPSGERRALLEFVARNRRWEWVPYLRFGWAGKSFVIEDRAPEEGLSVVRGRQRLDPH